MATLRSKNFATLCYDESSHFDDLISRPKVCISHVP